MALKDFEFCDAQTRGSLATRLGRDVSRTVTDDVCWRDVTDILASETQAAIVGSLATKIKRTGRIVESDFVIVLTVASGEITRFQMLENSFAVSKAARP